MSAAPSQSSTAANEIPDQADGPICIVLHDLRGGGAERACLRLAAGMVANGRTVDLVLIRRSGELLAEIPAGVRLFDLKCSRVAGALVPLYAYFRKFRPHAVLSALTHVNLVVILAARLSHIGIRIIVSERNQISKKSNNEIGIRNRLIYALTPLLYRAADRIIAVSEGVADDLKTFGGFRRNAIRVIHNPVFNSEIDLLAQEAPQHPWFCDASVPIILGVGRLHEQKAFDTLILAFARARAEIDCRLIILGEGPRRDSLAALAHDLGLAYDISLPGFCRNPFAFISRASAFVLSSRWEGFPNVLVEAMACGAPVIATDCPSGPREILECGKYGELVPVDDVHALHAALRKTLISRPNTAQLRARARCFNVQAATERYLAVLEGHG